MGWHGMMIGKLSPLQPKKYTANQGHGFKLKIDKISTFKFGRGYGFLRGAITALKYPLHDVSPQRWQRALGCLTSGNKNISKQMAQQLFPQLKITHSIADAVLITEYGRRTLAVNYINVPG